MKDIIETLKEQKDDLENFNSSNFNEDKVRLLSDAIFSLDECICELEKL
jgi:hypothetical protein